MKKKKVSKEVLKSSGWTYQDYVKVYNGVSYEVYSNAVGNVMRYDPEKEEIISIE
jgi:hypothetical protein